VPLEREEGLLAGTAHDLRDPVAAGTDRIEGQIAGTFVDRADNSCSRVSEAVDELFTAERMGEHTDVETVRRAVRKDAHLVG